jgi:hypothetical protein
MIPDDKDALAERLLNGSVPTENGCRRWTGAHTSKGYGHIVVRGRTRPVHRVAHEVWIGPIPEGFEIDHVRSKGCRHRDCIDPSHLEAVTHLENIRRKPQPSHCPEGHEYTKENTALWRRKNRPGMNKICRTCRNRKRREQRARKGDRDEC